jgi:hypothetical protein
MLIRTWRFITLVLTALLMGTTFCHVLEMPAKMHYSPSLYLTLHRSLYAAFGPPGPGPFIEIGAILAAIVLVFLVRNLRPAIWLTLLGALCLAAGLGIYFAFIEPANIAMKGMAVDLPLPDWTQWRDQWEYGHVAHFALHLVGFCALLLSMMVESSLAPTEVEHKLPEHGLHQPHWQPGR